MSVRAALAALVLAPALAAAQTAPASDASAPDYPRALALSVVSPTGEPVPGALVELWGDRTQAGLPKYGRRFTIASVPPPKAPVIEHPFATRSADAQGSVTIALPLPDTAFAVSAPGVGGSGVLIAGEIEGDALRVTLRPSTELAGEVRLADGTPAPRAVVIFDRSYADPPGLRGRAPADATTGDDGHFSATAEWGFLGQAWAVIGDVRTETINVAWPSSSPDKLVLQVPGAFHIRGSCKGPEGEAVGGFTVYADRRSTDRRQADVAADGSFDIPLVHPGLYELEPSDSATKRGLVLPSLPLVEVSADAPTADVALGFAKALTVSGTVSGEFKGSVFINPSSRLSSRFFHSSIDSAMLAGPGTFELGGFLPGQSCDLVASLDSKSRREGWPDRPTVRLRSVQAGATGLVIRFDDLSLRGGSALVHCVDAVSGAPLAGASVQSAFVGTTGFTTGHITPSKDMKAVLTEADGTALIRGLTLGDPHALYVTADGHAPFALGPFEAGPDLQDLTARLAPMTTRAVRLLDTDGTPAACATMITFIPPGDRAQPLFPLSKSAADASGGATVAAGQGQLRWVQAVKGDRMSPPELVMLEAGAPPFTLTLLDPAAPSPHGALDVLVVDGKQHPMAGMPVKLVPELFSHDFDGLKVSATTDETGHARLEGLLPAVWNATSRDDDRGFGYGEVVVEADAATSFVIVAD